MLDFLSTLRIFLLAIGSLVLLCSSVRAQTAPPMQSPAPTQSSAPASISIKEEYHHHLVFENSYVRIYFVEIPAHESTLLHRHDFPYISIPPGGADAVEPPSGAAQQPAMRGPRVGYMAGGFSHAVNNPSDRPLRNVAIELLRPQGTVRNRCAEAVRGQPHEDCVMPPPSSAGATSHYPVFESDEILVEYWDLAPNVTTPPWDDRLDLLVAGLTGVSITADSGIDSANAVEGGLLWIPASSKPVFKTTPERGGHFIVITFKDSKPAQP